jgi:ATP-dependent exoDNAse (exonuclease V) alpha subunit
MCEKLGDAKLTQIIRQRDQWAKDAVQEFARGDAASALKRYAEKGLVYVAENRDAAIAALVKAYASDGLKERQVKEKLVLAGTNLEVAIINSKIQAERLQAGHLGTGVQIGSASIREGDRVVFTKRNTVVGLENGSFGTVVRYSEEANLLHVRLDSKDRLVAVPLAYYDAIRLGYAVTDFKAQGATVDRAFVLTGGMMTHREASYVEASRSRDRTLFFTSSQEAGEELSSLAKSMSRSRRKDLAHDILQQRGPELSLQPHM